jgi:Cu-Zn family superoxide dismutase
MAFEGTALQYTAGANLNGIAASRDGRYLVTVQMGAGKLFRIDTVTRQVALINTGDQVLTSGDGLVLDGHLLYLVRNGPGEIVALKLSKDFLAAKVIKRLALKELSGPATAVIAHGRLIVANSQLGKRGANTATRPFTLTSIPLAAFK